MKSSQAKKAQQRYRGLCRVCKQTSDSLPDLEHVDAWLSAHAAEHQVVVITADDRRSIDAMLVGVEAEYRALHQPQVDFASNDFAD